MAKRRGNREGSIYFHHVSGKWCAQVSLDGRRLTKYFPTQKEAQDWILETRKKIKKGLTFKAAKLTVGNYLHYWLNSIEDSIKQTTWIDYRQGIKNHIAPTLGKIKMIDLKPTDIQLLINKKKAEGLSAWRLQYIKRILNKALRQAVALGIISSNPVLAVTVPRPPQKEMRFWNKDQVKTFLDCVESHRLEALYYLAFTTGLRQGELLGLRWADLDTENQRIYIKRQLRRVREKGLIYQELKTKNSRRVIIIGDLVLEKLANHRDYLKKEALFAGDDWGDKEFQIIFPSSVGTPLEPRNLYRHFQETTQKAQLPKIRFHDIRHTAATLMFREGIHPKVVQEILGHSSVSLTLDTYSHVIPSMQEEVADKLNNLLKL